MEGLTVTAFAMSMIGIGALVSCVGLIIPIQSNRHENEELYTIDLSTNSLDVKNGKINLKRIKTVFKEGDSVSVKTLNGPVVVYGVLSIIANNRIELLDENGRAFVFYYGIIENLKLDVFEYHSNMSGDQAASLEWFKNYGGIMVSIRCLDQGIDIPKISHAIIVASSQNPRQFIQRRGRVLRACEGKFSAVIFDAIVVPVCLDEEPGQLSLLKSELQRSIQFSESAINRSGANKLVNIAIEL